VAKPAPLIDLDAHRRESAYPDGIPVVLGGEQFMLPAQLPLEVFDPFLAEDLGLVEILRDFFKNSDDSDTSAIFDALIDHPGLPKQIIAAIKEALAVLFGAVAFERFENSTARPGVGDYLFLARSLFGAYGVTLGEALASPDSSESTGATPSPTSPGTTPESTSTPSGSQENPKLVAQALAEVGVVEPVWDTPVITQAPLVATPVPFHAPVPVPTAEG
jgi:hypothetical protein